MLTVKIGEYTDPASSHYTAECQYILMISLGYPNGKQIRMDILANPATYEFSCTHTYQKDDPYVAGSVLVGIFAANVDY